jgi:hypothetical protein
MALPVVAALAIIATDRIGVRSPFWMYGEVFEFDVVDARDKRSLVGTITRTYVGALAGVPATTQTLGEPYHEFRGMTPQIGYGGLCCIVKRSPRTRFLRTHDISIVEGLRFRIEAEGYEPFDFAPVDASGRPLAFKAWDVPVFRIELRPVGRPEVPTSWSTRPELKRWAPK